MPYSLKCHISLQMSYILRQVQTWKVNGVIELSITSVMQKASIRTISSLPYMELRATQRWVLTNQKSKLRNYIFKKCYCYIIFFA